MYCVTRYPTPLLNTPAFRLCFGGECGSSLQLDDQHLLRAVETVLFPGSKVELLEKIDHPFISRVRTQEYISDGPLYLDERFLQKGGRRKERLLPSIDSIRNQMLKLLGTRYVWGGNWPEGIPQLLKWYPPSFPDPALCDLWQLKGVDCSGLLYYATNGYTPRNTSQLIDWGEEIPIGSGFKALDLIVSKGHVICVLDEQTAIESRVGMGVVVSQLEERLAELTQKNIAFVIRRWHPTLTHVALR